MFQVFSIFQSTFLCIFIAWYYFELTLSEWKSIRTVLQVVQNFILKF